MDAEKAQPLSPAEVADIDAKYRPFPSFSEWPVEVPRIDLWEGDLVRFQQVASQASDQDLRRAQEIAMRTAAFDTGAIEGLYSTDRGLTFTVATQAAAWEQRVTNESSPDALALFRAQLEAFELVLDLATSRLPKLTQSWIRRLHEVVTSAQETYLVHTPVGVQEQPLPQGEYKKFPNHVRTAAGEIHAYAPVEQTQSEMQRLTDEMASEAFRGAHPILQTSYAHYALTVIHPFADGNGRVARAVSSVFTYRAARVPLVVLAHQRDSYFQALARADSGDPSAFIGFISQVARSALELVTESLMTAQAPQPNTVLEQFRAIYVAQGDLSHGQLDELANGLVDELLTAAQDQAETLSVPDGIRISWVGGTGGNPSPPPGFRAIVSPGHRSVRFDFEAAAPGRAEVHSFIDIFVSTESDSSTTVLIRVRGTDSELMLGLADLSPELSSAARLRIANFIQRLIGEDLERLLEQSKEQMRHMGY